MMEANPSTEAGKLVEELTLGDRLALEHLTAFVAMLDAEKWPNYATRDAEFPAGHYRLFADLITRLSAENAGLVGEAIDMVLFCPACGVQHIDEPEPSLGPRFRDPGRTDEWTNPPHRSHLCLGCGHIWRPADVATNGVAAIKTRGQNDSAIISAEAQVTALQARIEELEAERARNDRIGTHGPGCHTWGHRHYECALRHIEELEAALTKARAILGLTADSTDIAARASGDAAGDAPCQSTGDA